MVYRGKPSAGCEQCRKAKKRCDLGMPACTRCTKLKKQCTGYRDTTQLQIQDESEAIKLKATRQQKAKNPAPAPTPAPTTHVENGLPTPANALTPHSESSASSDDTIELPPLPSRKGTPLLSFEALFADDMDIDPDLQDFQDLDILDVPMSLGPTPDELATTHFFNQFTSHNGHWTWLREKAQNRMDPVLDLAIRACGMAALDNVQSLTKGREYSRSLYAEALNLLNSALRDPKRSKTDDSLVAVAMLGYYENLTCDGRQSIQSWKAHIHGATQLLKLRGKGQFKTQIGRMLFRETRAQILINCIWEDFEPPSFLYEWDHELQMQTPNLDLIIPSDHLLIICFDFSSLRSRMRVQTITDADAMDVAAQLEMRLIEWSIETMQNDAWRYHDIEVPDSPHVWNGVVHSYQGHPAASVWNTYRSMRIMLTRTQELLCRRLSMDMESQDEQLKYFRSVRRQITEDICSGIPSQLGHASPAYNSPCILISAYGSIWPLFFAGTCALERIGPNAWKQAVQGHSPQTSSAATAQASWIIGRMQYISQHVGIHWADGVAATLRGDFAMQDDEGQPEYEDDINMKMYWKDKLKYAKQQQREHGNNWLKKVQESGRGPRMLIEKESPLSDALDKPRKEHGPIWLGRGRPGTGPRDDWGVGI